ncbi:villin-2-like [Dorcoceras hygrometricum]|uniref:Villin-2-like n=1 Tax=Dorcoceras hygrometricum TaxID=472368 RepID=A0A2Z7CHL9_9LAMI|nr:villin-2-like [Dorcoceras hygrometricum]
MMTPAYLMKEAVISNDNVSIAGWKKSRISNHDEAQEWISDDDISSDVIIISNSVDGLAMIKPVGTSSKRNQQTATVIIASCCNSRKLQEIQTRSNQSQAAMYQSQATVYPVAGYSVLHIQSTGNPDTKKLKEITRRSNSVDGLAMIKPAGTSSKRNQQTATVIIASCCTSRKLQEIQTRSNQSQAEMYQSQATVYPVAGYSVLHIQSTGNPDTKNLKEITRRSS